MVSENIGMEGEELKVILLSFLIGFFIRMLALPQGLCPGSVALLVCIFSEGDLICLHGVKHHLYADFQMSISSSPF